MTLLINPGSGPVAQGPGYTNTYETARAEAERWLARIHADGMTDVTLADEHGLRDGRWQFTFRHRVTGVAVHLETHGIDDLDAYGQAHIFPPRVYWHGSSTGTPCLEDWAAPGFTPVRTYVAATAEEHL